MSSKTDRDLRQIQVHRWCVDAFGEEHAKSVKQRAVRLLEEAVEAYQAAGGEAAMAHRLVDYVFARPVGEIAQEIGGVSITLLAFAQAAGCSAESAEAEEFRRIMSKPVEHFSARNAAKNAAGFSTTGEGHD